MAVTLNEGTQTVINTTLVGGTETQVIRLDQGAGTVSSLFTGTLAAVTNLAKGTITKLEGGTLALTARVGNVGTVESGSVVITKGTISNGTMLPFGILHAAEFNVRAGTTGTALGTLVPGTAGSVIYITRLTISVGTASNVVIASGGTGTPLAGTYFLNQNGGVALMPIQPPYRTTSGSALVFSQTATGSISIEAGGWVG